MNNVPHTDAFYDDLRRMLEAHARGVQKLVSLPPEVAAVLEAVETAESGAVDVPETPGEEGVAAAAPAPLEHAPGEAIPPPPKVTGNTPEEALAALERIVSGCTRCTLSGSRTQTVFGAGHPRSDVVFVGEAPGYHEDKQGIPFVGRAGQLLTDIIEKGMGLKRADVYICNVLKCRPPENRDPKPVEVAACEPFLMQQLEIMNAKVIIALGKYAAQTLLKCDLPVGRMRGRWWEYHGIPLRVTYHPAYLLRNPPQKHGCWEDIQAVMQHLGIKRPK
ncbi:MAG: uracil-DNA glycosylase [Candidatus Hydrogenedentota bacterium]